jgi:hypothetical protein
MLAAWAAGYELTLLMLLSPTGHIDEDVDFTLVSLNIAAPGVDAPKRIIEGLIYNPQEDRVRERLRAGRRGPSVYSIYNA